MICVTRLNDNNIAATEINKQIALEHDKTLSYPCMPTCGIMTVFLMLHVRFWPFLALIIFMPQKVLAALMHFA
jgi:hypothetical protein